MKKKPMVMYVGTLRIGYDGERGLPLKEVLGCACLLGNNERHRLRDAMGLMERRGPPHPFWPCPLG